MPPVIDIKLSQKQKQFVASSKTYRMLMGGIGSGKTVVNVLLCFILAWFIHPGKEGLVCAPTYPLLWGGWFALWCKHIPNPETGPPLWTYNEKHSEIRLRNGSLIRLKYLSDPNAVQGTSPAWVSIDEAFQLNEPMAFQNAVARAGRDCTPGQPPYVLVTTAPPVPGHWLLDHFGKGPDGVRFEGDSERWSDELHETIRIRMRDNPHVHPSSEANLRATNTPDWCRRWIDGEIVAGDLSVFPEFDATKHVVEPRAIPRGGYREIAIGVDWGTSANGSMLVVGKHDTGTVYVRHEEVHAGLNYDSDGWLKIASRLNARYHPECFVADPSGAGFIGILRAHFDQGPTPDVIGADNRLAESIRRIRSLLHRDKLLISSECKELITEMGRWEYIVSRGQVTTEPTKRDDHVIDALRYAVMRLCPELALENL